MITEDCLRCGDCLEVLKDLQSNSMDLVLCDLPYGTTSSKWDIIIAFEPLWEQYKRVCKSGAAIVLTCSQPFTTLLISSNPKWFRYEWIWEKHKPVGHLNAKKMPMNAHESIVVFCDKMPRYFPQGLKVAGDVVSRTNNGAYNECSKSTVRTHTGYPRTILKFPHDKSKGHPAQKPVALMEYFIKTYSQEGEWVLDNCMGSGTTGVACQNTGRNFIGIEKDPDYFELAKNRILAAAPTWTNGFPQ